MLHPTLDDWRNLYGLMDRVKTLAPWRWMNEDAIFSVQNPDGGEQGYVSVMGTLGEHLAISVYLGARGLSGFWSMQEAGPAIQPERLFEIPQLQASFEDRDQLDDHDRANIKELGLKYRGKQAWPHFRSYRPSFVPWYLEQAEARFLAAILEQLLDVAPRYQLNHALFRGPTRDHYLCRVPRGSGDSRTWEDQFIVPAQEETVGLNLRMNLEALNYLKKLPPTRQQVEIDLFMLLSGVREKGEDARPYFPSVLLTLDVRSKMVIGTEMIPPLPTLESVYEQTPGYVVTQLAQAGLRPGVVTVRHDMLYQVLGPISKELGFKLIKRRHLPNLDKARMSLMQWMGVY